MNPRFVVACIIFAGSYLPLSLILLAQNVDYSPAPNSGWVLPWLGWHIALKNPAFSIGIFAACLICFLITLPALASVPARTQIIIKEAEPNPADLMSYVLPYVVSFMSIDYQETGKFVGFLIFLGWMFWITHASGQIILNPVLAVLGWKLYKIVYTHPGDQREFSGMAIAKHAPSPGDRPMHGAIQEVMVLR
jgi:hypothetical protein